MSQSQKLWLAASLPLLAICVALGIMFGWGMTGAIFAGAVLPDISLIGAFAAGGRLKPQRVKFYNLLHTMLFPAGIALVGCIVAAFTQNFTVLAAALAWFTHIAIDRACGYRLRASDGSIRPARLQEVAAR